MRIRPATAEDIPALLELERRCAGASHWTEAQYGARFGSDPESLLLVIDTGAGSAIIGFLVARRAGPDWELENLAVDPERRRSGLGQRLLLELRRGARSANGEAVFLEVRESNVGARQLYEKLGYIEIGRRRAYYVDPVEDAVLYRLNLA